MTEFQASTGADTPPEGLTESLQALWWDRKGDWPRAHEAVAAAETRDAAWVHAYLHRKEGDAGNARYWYGRARQPACTLSLDQEWSALAAALLDSSVARSGPA